MRTRIQKDIVARLGSFGAQSGWHGGDVVQLTFRGERFRDAALAKLGSLPSLQRLVLIDTGVTAQGLQSLRSLPLRELRIFHADALKLQPGPEAAEQFQFPSLLTSVWLVDTNLDDGVMAALARLPELTDLTLSGTPVTDASIESLAALRQLKRLAVQGTQMSAEGVDSLRRELPKAVIRSDP